MLPVVLACCCGCSKSVVWNLLYDICCLKFKVPLWVMKASHWSNYHYLELSWSCQSSMHKQDHCPILYYVGSLPQQVECSQELVVVSMVGRFNIPMFDTMVTSIPPTCVHWFWLFYSLCSIHSDVGSNSDHITSPHLHLHLWHLSLSLTEHDMMKTLVVYTGWCNAMM